MCFRHCVRPGGRPRWFSAPLRAAPAALGNLRPTIRAARQAAVSLGRASLSPATETAEAPDPHRRSADPNRPGRAAQAGKVFTGRAPMPSRAASPGSGNRSSRSRGVFSNITSRPRAAAIGSACTKPVPEMALCPATAKSRSKRRKPLPRGGTGTSADIDVQSGPDDKPMARGRAFQTRTSPASDHHRTRTVCSRSISRSAPSEGSHRQRSTRSDRAPRTGS